MDDIKQVLDQMWKDIETTQVTIPDAHKIIKAFEQADLDINNLGKKKL